MKKRLVRNLELPKVLDSGKVYTCGKLQDGSEFLDVVDEQLAQTLNEYTNMKSGANSAKIDKIAEIIELSYLLAEIMGYTHCDIEELIDKKVVEDGGFSKRFYIEEAE